MPTSLALLAVGPCWAFDSNKSAGCGTALPASPGPITATYVGVYPPFVYAIIGAPATLADNSRTAFYVARAVNALLVLLLLFGAWVCSRGLGSRLGWLVAVGPLTLFLGSTISTNGTEVAGAICFTAAGIARANGDRRLRTTICWVAGGFALALSKSLGPGFLLLDVVLVALVSRRSIRQLVPRLRKPSAAAVAVAVAEVVGLAWSIAFVPSTGSSSASTHLKDGVHYFKTLIAQSFDDFGWLDTPMPFHGYALGLFGASVLLIFALLLGTWRQRLTLTLAFAAFAVVSIGFTAIELADGFPGQARYAMAALVSLFIVAGATVEGSVRGRGTRSRTQLERPITMMLIILAMSAVNVLAWLANARRYAVGDEGRVLFFEHPQWTPPLGWPLMIAMLMAGVIMLGYSAAAPREDLAARTSGPA